jgi:hypothetical protein
MAIIGPLADRRDRLLSIMISSVVRPRAG